MTSRCMAPADPDGMPCGRLFADAVNVRGEIVTAVAAWRDHYVREHEAPAYRHVRRTREGVADGWAS